MERVLFGEKEGLAESLMWQRRFLYLAAALGLVRLLFLLVSPLELSPDEAYYWDWSRRLAFGYYSKPPMVAWLIRLSTTIFSSTEFGVRFPATLLSILTAIGLFLSAKAISGARAGFYTALCYSATIGAAVSGYIMTIDAPLLCFWIWTIYLFLLAMKFEQNRLAGKALFFWAASGLLCGLGLLSKQTMVAVSGACGLFFLFSTWLSGKTASLFRHRGLYLFYFFQIALAAPFLLWNYKHGWITFSHTAHHFEQAERTNLLRLDTFFDLLGTQLGIITPLIFILCLCAAVFLLRLLIKAISKRNLQSFPTGPVMVLELSGFLPLVAVFCLSLKQRVNANWPAPFYLSLCVLLGIWLAARLGGEGRCVRRCRSLFVPGVWLGLFMVFFLYFLPFLFVHTSLAGSKADPTVRLRGWKVLASRVDDVLSSVPMPERTFVAARRRQTVSELAFYMRGQPRVYRWNGPERHVKSQYELWPGPFDKIGWDGVFVVDKDKSINGIDGCFKSFEFIKRIRVRLGGNRERVFKVYLGRGLEKWSRR